MQSFSLCLLSTYYVPGSWSDAGISSLVTANRGFDEQSSVIGGCRSPAQDPFFFCSSQLSPCLPCPSSQQPCPETLPLLSPKIWPATKMWLLFWGAAVFRDGLGAPDASLSPSNTVLWDYLWQAHCAAGEWGLGLSPLLSLQGLEQNRHKSLSSRARRDSPGARW